MSERFGWIQMMATDGPHIERAEDEIQQYSEYIRGRLADPAPEDDSRQESSQ